MNIVATDNDDMRRKKDKVWVLVAAIRRDVYTGQNKEHPFISRPSEKQKEKYR